MIRWGKRFLVLSLILLIAVSLLGCEGNLEEKKGDVVIRWGIYADPARLEIAEKLVEVFEAEQPGIKVEVEATPFAQYYEKLGSQIGAGTAYDIMMISGAYFSMIAPEGGFLNLDGLIEESNINLDEYTTEDANSKYNGGTYALPWELDIHGLFYNKDLFDKAGVPYPDENWTWNDLLKTAKTLTKGKQWGFYSENHYPSWISFIGQAGGSILDRHGNVAINESEAESAIEFMVDLIYKHKVSPAPGQLPEGVNPFHTGTVAMSIDGSYSIPPTLELDFDWDIAPLPKERKRAVAYWTQGLAIYSRTEHPEEAWEFMEFLVSKKGQELFANTHMATPSLISVAQSEAYLASGVDKNLKVFVDSYQYGEPVPFERFFEIMRGTDAAIQDPFSQAWRGEISAKAAVEIAAENIKNVLEH